jgi:chromosome segregation ATPase
MAREASITLEQLSTVANDIVKAGGKVTSRSIRDAIGTGSQATICKLLQQWRGSQVRQSEVIDDTISQAVIKAISNEIAGKVRQAIADTTGSLADLQVEHNLLINESDVQALEIEVQNDQLAGLNARFSSLSGKNQQIEADFVSLTKKLKDEQEDTKLALSALAKAELKLEGLPKIEAEVISVRAELLAEKALSAQYHESSAVALAKFEAEVNQRKIVDANLSDVNNRLIDAQSELNKERLNSQSLQNRLDTTTRDLVLANSNIEKHALEIKSGIATIASVNQTASELQGQVKLQDKTISELKTQIESLNKQIETLNKQKVMN